MSPSSSRQSLLRAVPNLSIELATAEVATFVMARATQPRWLASGQHKQVVDLGNGTVARLYRSNREDAYAPPLVPNHSPFAVQP